MATPQPSKLKQIRQTSGVTTGYCAADSLVTLQHVHRLGGDAVFVTDRQAKAGFEEMVLWSLPGYNHTVAPQSLLRWDVPNAGFQLLEVFLNIPQQECRQILNTLVAGHAFPGACLRRSYHTIDDTVASVNSAQCRH